MMHKNEPHIPAANYDLMTPLYDPAVKWIMREARFKRRLVAQIAIEADMAVLDSDTVPEH